MKKQKKYNILSFYKTGKNENFTLAALQIEVRDWDYFWSFGLSFYSGYIQIPWRHLSTHLATFKISGTFKDV